MQAHGKNKAKPSLSEALPTVFIILILATFLLSSCERGGTPSERGVEGIAEVPADEDPVLSFLVCGDPHGRTDLLGRVISDLREGEFLVIVGDLSTGKGEGQLREMRDFLDRKGVEFYVVPGDNDQPRGDPSAFQRVFGPIPRSLDIGRAHLVFLNNSVPGVGIPREDLEWLEKDLAKAAGKRIVAFAHVPPGAPVDISQGFQASESASQRRLKELLVGAGVEVVYCGHLHAYMVYSSGPPRVVVTGGVGARPHISEEAGGFHHYLRVTLSSREIREEVVRL